MQRSLRLAIAPIPLDNRISILLSVHLIVYITAAVTECKGVCPELYVDPTAMQWRTGPRCCNLETPAPAARMSSGFTRCYRWKFKDR